MSLNSSTKWIFMTISYSQYTSIQSIINSLLNTKERDFNAWHYNYAIDTHIDLHLSSFEKLTQNYHLLKYTSFIKCENQLKDNLEVRNKMAGMILLQFLFLYIGGFVGWFVAYVILSEQNKIHLKVISHWDTDM